MEDRKEIVNGKEVLIRRIKEVNGDNEEDGYMTYLLGEDGISDALNNAEYYYVKNQDGTIDKVYIDGKEHPIEEEDDILE